ncbi:UrcA family protein [Novosphingobium fluoreni]|uniref:UrcA family protein n=1 Tax=Novosphingobium fluoreni TaxID=1391222 RepID=UPI003DA174A8
MKTGLMALAAVALTTSVSANATENPFAQDQAVLNLRGIDLSTADGQQRLAIRMDRAARSVCGDRLATVHLDLEAKTRECRAAVVADVRSQIEARTAYAPSQAAAKLALAQ